MDDGAVTPVAVASTSLSQAIANLAGKRNTLALQGKVAAVLADGTLTVQVNGQSWRVHSVVDQSYEAGQYVHVAKADNGGYVVLGIV